MGLIEHLEQYLGPIADGLTRDPDGQKMPFPLVRFLDVPLAGVTAYATLGISRHRLKIGADRELRQELVVLASSHDDRAPAYSMLYRVGMNLLTSHLALSRGEVLDWGEPIAPGSNLTALYMASPVYLPDEFAELGPKGDETIFVWIVPISSAEAHFVHHHGPDAFEDILVEKDPPLSVYDRSSVVSGP